jgi:cobalt-zinc-cadmium efflux system membrane fusion protein
MTASETNSTPPGNSRHAGRWIVNGVIVAALIAIGIWGHQTGWTLPKLNESSRDADDGEKKGDWCDEHHVPKAICVECNADLMPRPQQTGWCKEHGVHECVLCNPQLAQTTAVVTPEDRQRATRALAFAERPVNSITSKRHLRRIQFASAEAFQKSGIEVAPVSRETVTESVPVTGEIVYDHHRIAHLSSRAAGSVWKVFKHIGERAERGEVLALIEAGDVGKAKAEYLQAVVQLDLRQKTRDRLQSGGVTPEPRVQEADIALREAKLRVRTARQALVNLGLPMPPEDPKGVSDEQLAEQVQFLGIPPELVKGLDRRTASSNLLPLRAPQSGVVVAGDIVAGEVVTPTILLYELVDPSHLWLNLEVRLEDAERIRVNESPIRFRPDGMRDELTGMVEWVSTQADPKTRTVQVRAVLPNPKGQLRANTFGSGRIILREDGGAITVPNEAVHTDGDSYFVFVRDKEFLTKDSLKVFHVRSVRLGAKSEKSTEIIAGVLPDEVVATKGSEAMRGELLRDRFGESDCCVK